MTSNLEWQMRPAIQAKKQRVIRPRTKRPKADEIDLNQFEEDQTCTYDSSQSERAASIPTTPCRPSLLTANGKECEDHEEPSLSKRKRPPRCKFVSLFEPETKCYKKFKAYKELDMPFASNGATIVELEDPVQDDDYQTDQEQIKSSLTSLNSSIVVAFKRYLQGKCAIANLERKRKSLPSSSLPV